MGRLLFSINVTLDGCYDHREVIADDELHRYRDANALFDASDGILFGRVTYELMEKSWRPVARQGKGPKSMVAFARKLEAKPKYVVTTTRTDFDWNNTFLLKGDISEAVSKLKERNPRGLLLGGGRLASTLARLGLIDEYRFLVHPIIAGHGPTLFSDIGHPPRLKLIDERRFKSGVMALHYRLQH
jgi:dihydrofolate reductase